MRNLILLLAVLFLGCGKSSPTEEAVAFLEFPLPDLSEWVNDPEPDKLYVIRTPETLEHFVGNAVEIDYDKYSLLLAAGRTSSGIHKITKTLMRDAAGTLRFDIKIYRNIASVVQPWSVAVLIPATLETEGIKFTLEKI